MFNIQNIITYNNLLFFKVLLCCWLWTPKTKTKTVCITDVGVEMFSVNSELGSSHHKEQHVINSFGIVPMSSCILLQHFSLEVVINKSAA